MQWCLLYNRMKKSTFRLWKTVHYGRGGVVFARWTTDYDCGYDTEWWYIVKEAPFTTDNLGAKNRKHIRSALRAVSVRLIDPTEYAAELCRVYNDTVKTYKNYNASVTEEDFIGKYDTDWWGAFANDSGILVGYMGCKRMAECVETLTAKYLPEYLRLRASDAIHYHVLDYYLNQCGYKYVCSGSRSISHKTNAQEYKIKTFGFRKAYCKLHVAYAPKYRRFIKLLYPFRKLFHLFDGITKIHQLNGVLIMEEIVRRQ